jgi:hypothetical protein
VGLFSPQFAQSAALYIQIGCLLSAINIYDEKLKLFNASME